MKIISLQISDDLLDRFEEIRSKSGFQSKSEALRHSIVKFIEDYEVFENLEGYKIMIINLVHPFKDTISEEITEIYSQFNTIIKAITDWRILEKVIEIVLIVGEFGMIKDLYYSLSKIKDVSCSIHEVVID